MQTIGGATELMYACQQCMENEVLDLIKKQPNSVRDRDRTSKTPLHYCAENPNTSCAEVVLRAAPELVNAQDDNGYSTLHLAIIAGNKALIKLLIMKGADVNVHDNEGHSAVHWAIVSSEKEALEMIIRAGANPSTPDIHGGYPLHYAVQMCGSGCDYTKSFEDAVRVVETLLNFGVDVNVKDKDSRQPILWAASAGSPEAVIHLVSSGACVEAADKDGLTALHCAASRGHTTTLETLISLCGASVDVIDGNGCSALFYSVTLGHADATELLLRLGAEPNRQDRKGRTPAHCGAAKGQIETLRILQKHGGNLWLRNVKGDIPLHEAVASGRKDLVLWLLSQNPEAINIANNDGRCPLHIASMYNNTEMVKVLLDSKSLVNPIMRTSKGVLMTPLNVALCKGHRSCGKYLQLHGGVPFSKVARLEPASGFAVRLSPSDEMMVKTVEMSREILTTSQSKIPKSRSSAEIQGSQESDKTETSEKRKFYRRRKKKKSSTNLTTQSSDSDSDESIQDVKLKVPGNRKVKTSNGVSISPKENSDENLKMEKLKPEKNSQNISAANSQTDSSKEVVEINEKKLTAKKVTKRKTLQRNKSFNETKNVSDLSPEYFPPLMQTINQLDMVMMEPDMEENKVEGDEGSLKMQETAVLDSGRDTLVKEAEVVKENNAKYRLDAGFTETEAIVENQETKIEIKEDKIEKTTVPSQEDSIKKADVRKNETEIKTVDSKTIDSKGENGVNRKSVKSPKTSGNSGSVKKDERFSKNEKSSSAGSGGSEKPKKTVRPKSPKVVTADQTKDKTNASMIKNKNSEDEKVLDHEKKTEESMKIKENEKEKVSDESGENKKDNGDDQSGKNKKEKGSDESGENEKVSDEIGENKKEKGNDEDGETKKEEANEEITENEKNETAKTEPETNDLSEGTLLKNEPPSDLKEFPEVRNLEKDTLAETESREKELSSSIENVTEKPLTNRPSDNARPPELQPSRTPAPKEESESVAGNENPDVIVTEKEETSVVPAKENRNEIQTSAEASEQSSDRERAIVAEENHSKTSPLETLPARHIFLKTLPREAELNVGKAKHETNQGESSNAETQDSAGAETSVERTEERRAPAVEKTKNDTATEENDENERNVPEEEYVHDGASPRKNDCDDEHKPPKATRVSRLCRRQRDFKGNMNEISITQLVQNTLRKYHMERGIFYQLLELKRYQIRSGKANEQVLVKRLADEYERSRVFLGMKPFSGVYKFREFEKFLYDQLKALNARRSFLIPEMKSYDDIDAMSGFLKKSRYKIINDVPQPEMVCTCITQRCHHSACAYTSVPCSGYITDLRRLRCHRTRKEGFFPRIEQPPSTRSDAEKIPSQPATLELIQGSEKHVITLPQNSPGKGKRYYVTFTIKSAPVFKEEEDLVEGPKSLMKHRHAKSV